MQLTMSKTLAATGVTLAGRPQAVNVIAIALIGPDNMRSTVSVSNDPTVRDVVTSKYDLFWQTTKRNGTIVDPFTTKVTDGDTVTIEQMSERD